MKISQFNSLPKKGEPHKSDQQTTIHDLYGHIKYGTWKEKVEEIRTQLDDKKRSFLKKNLPSFTISGTFIERNQDNLIEHSGFICIDVDHFNDKKQLLDDPYTYILFKSSSGSGLAVIVKVNKDKHKESFKWLQNYYYQSYGIVIDSAPQNVASLRFASYDPEIFINEKSKTSKFTLAKERKAHSLPIIVPGDIVGQMVNECVGLGINIAPDYESYYKLAYAIADGFGEGGREWFYALCSVSEKYDSRHAEKKYDYALKGNKQGITIGTFYWMLKKEGIHVPNDTSQYVQVAAMAKKSGRDKESVTRQLTEINGVSEEQAIALVEEVFKRDDISLKSSIDDPEQLIKAIFEWMQQNHPLRRNILTGMIEDGKLEVKKERINSIYLRARMFFNTKDITKDLIESYMFSDFIPEYNPLTEYFEQNKFRRSTGNIQMLAKSIRSDTPMKDVFVRKWMISIIAAYNWHPVRSVLALVGGQHNGKTEFFRRLMPEKLKKYYGESKLDAGKDDDLLMCQKLIIMDDELGGKSKSDEKRFKELTSKQIFSLRAPYGKGNEDFKRLAILCGTSNEIDIINDPTGNTRTLPIVVDSIDHELYNSINKDELIMEAYHAYESGEDFQLSKAELSHLHTLSSDFETTPFERELILKFFCIPQERPGAYPEWLTATEIKDYIEVNSKQKIISMKKFGIELRNIFGSPKSKKLNGSDLKRYEVVKCSGNQSFDNQQVNF